MIQLFEFDELPSTQDKAFELIESDTTVAPVAVSTKSQTQGRGTRGRDWHSEANRSLAMSLAWRPRRKDLSGLSLVLGLAVAEHCRLTELRLKWPNDLMLNSQKVGGILVETRTQGSQFLAAVGIGLNLKDQRDAPYKGLGRNLHPRDLAQDLFYSVQSFEENGFSEFKSRFEQRMWGRGESHRIKLDRAENQITECKILGVSDLGALRIEALEGEMTLSNAEICYDSNSHC